MMKGVLIQPHMEENKSNLTSASIEVSGSSSSINKNDPSSVGLMYPPEYFSSLMNQPDHPHTVKKKRNQPCQPGPDAEVIAYSPRTLLSTNRFVCEICNKGFQRDQNLQLHRRGHNLPWKLKKRTNKECIRKKVYVCPDKSCAHNDPSRALGDLTGIKKHFFRKHGEKKWKCERCSKRYAVQSDWKAHSKICGTREYVCECGTLFSRKDSFMSHRGFCDVSLEARQAPPIALNNNNNKNNNNNTIISSLLKPPTTTYHNNDHMINFQQTTHQSHHFNTTTTNAPYRTFPFPIKREQQNYTTSTTTLTQELPPWIAYTHLIGPGSTPPMHHQTTQSPPPSLFQDLPSQNNSDQDHHNLLNPHPTTLPFYYPPPPPTPHHEEFVHNMRSYEIIADHNAVTGGGSTESGASAAGGTGEFISPSLFQDHDMTMMMINNHHTLSNYASAGFEGLSFQISEGDHNYENLPATGGQFSNMTSTTTEDQISGSANDDESGAGVNDEMTRDFLGLKSLFQNDYPMEYNWFKGLFEPKCN